MLDKLRQNNNVVPSIVACNWVVLEAGLVWVIRTDLLGVCIYSPISCSFGGGGIGYLVLGIRSVDHRTWSSYKLVVWLGKVLV